MPLSPAITKVEQLAETSAVVRLLAWNRDAVESAKFDRDELSITIQRSCIREACAILRDDSALKFSFLSDVTCVDWYPSEPRFEMVYHLLSMLRRERLRLKVQLSSSDAIVDTVTSLWPAANFFEREIFDLFGVRFHDHPYLRRILMPEDWEGYPLRKDYPVEGFR
jgi:NADH-quinone oxidoreductase subunit C